MWKIYKITCGVTGKAYIGQTKVKLQARIHKHISNARKPHPCYFGKAIKKHGWENFKVDVLEDCIISQAEADEKECRYILDHGTLVPNGYNIKNGGQSSGYNDNSIKKFIPKNYEKKSIKVTGIKEGIATSFRTIRDASKFYSIEPQHIQTAIRRSSRYTKGVYFYKSEDFTLENRPTRNNKKWGKFVKIQCPLTETIYYFESVEDSKKILGNVKNFSTYVNKNWKINGYYCFYITETEYFMSQPNNRQTI